MKYLLLLTLIFFVNEIAHAQPGKLDSSFGNKGWVTENFIPVNADEESALQVFAVENGGYIAIIQDLNGRANALARFLSNGSLDSGYGKKGYTYLNIATVLSAAKQADGKILVAGQTYDNSVPENYIFNLNRYNTDGSPDNTFSGDGKQNTGFAAVSIALGSNGKIIVTGSANVRRYNKDGSADTTLDLDGILTYQFGNDNQVYSVAVQKNGKIIVAGTILVSIPCDSNNDPKCEPEENTESIVVRYNKDGTQDFSFGEQGKITSAFHFNEYTANGSHEYISSAGILGVQGDDKIVLAGPIKTGGTFDVGLERYTSNGQPDVTFNIGGAHPADFGADDFPSSLTFQSNGKIIVTAWTGEAYAYNTDNFAMARYNSNGTLDSSFSEDGKTITDFGFNDFANYAALLSTGKIIVAGGTTSTTNWDYAFAQYNSDGSPDNTLTGTGKKIGYIPAGIGSLTAIAVQSDGKKIVAGSILDSLNRNNFFVSRYNADGTPDKLFSDDGKQLTDFGYRDAYVNSLALQNDGRIVVAGLVFIDGNENFAIARYNANGSPDSTFSEDGRQITFFTDYNNGAISSVLIQNDGKIIVGGTLIDLDFHFYFAVARYHSNGSPDNTFGNNGLQIYNFGTSDAQVHAIALQSDGKIVAAGGVFINGNEIFAIVRYNTNGSPDNTFDKDGLQTTDFGNNNGVSSLAIQPDGRIIAGGAALARYNVNGSPDSSFAGNGKLITPFGCFALAIQNDGKIITSGGVFNSNFIGNISISRIDNNGSFDSTFDSDGKIIVDLGGDERGDASAIYNNKLYVAGNNTIAAFTLTGNSNKAPIVTITTPTNNSVYTAPAAISINAAASDADGTITSVQFYNGSILLFTDSVSPYSYSINNVTPGNYSLIAKTTDNSGLSGNSATIAFSVMPPPKKAPAINISNPVTNTMYIAPAIITINATASDPDGTISNVKFYSGTTLLTTDSTSPYSYTINNAAAGSYKFYAQVTDNSGLKNSSSSIAVFVAAASLHKTPAVSITSPANNSNYPALTTLLLQAAASDTDGTITSVKFYNGSALLKTDSTSPYTCSTTPAAAGIYSFVAQAIDNSGLVSNSATVTVSVGASANKAPAVTLSGPVNNSMYIPSSAIILTAIASDTDGTISSVKFYNGSTLLATDSTSPYGYTMINAAAGSYKFFAKATNNKGLINSSSTVSVFVVPGASGKAPVVKLINPANNEIHYAPGTIFMRAVATDTDGTIARVKFYMGSTLLITDSTFPYSYTITNLPVGNYSFTAKVTDNKGLESNSATAAVPVLAPPNKAPVINITSPVNNMVYSAPVSVILNATASDADGSVTNVRFYNGTTLLKTVSTSPYTYTLTNISAGNYKFYAKATDNNGFTNSSSTIYVVITGQSNNDRNATATNASNKSSASFAENNKSEIMGNPGLQLTPNPAHDILHIYTTCLKPLEKQTISIISASGIVIKTIKTIGSTQAVPINISSFANGMYIIKITTSAGVIYSQFIKF